MTNVKIRYPIKTSIGLTKAALAGIYAAGILGMNAIGYEHGKAAADHFCGTMNNEGSYAYSRCARINHGKVRNEVFENNGILYYLELPGIEAGMAAHNREHHRTQR